MKKLCRFLEKHGYKTLNLSYRSTRFTLEYQAEYIHPAIEAFAQQVDGRVHFVGYSMGGLLVRAYLHRYPLPNLGRVVMLGVPNLGSEVADYWKDFYLYKKLYGPAGQQLITNQTGFGHIFGSITYEAGSIAGNRSIDFISSRMIRKPNDGKVSVESTKLPELKDHIVIAATHTFFPSYRSTCEQTLSFLQNGQFRHV